MQYNAAAIFYKHTDLLPYFHAHYDGCNISDEQYAKIQSHYAPERDVRLILLIRYEGNKVFCRIKCPINPMPIKGEFEAVSLPKTFDFLRQQGWVHKESFNLNMFR